MTSLRDRPCGHSHGRSAGAAQEGREKDDLYVCVYPKKPNTFTVSPLAEAEWLPLFAAANHLDGFLRWAYNSWNRNPFEKTDFGNWPAGTATWFIPAISVPCGLKNSAMGWKNLKRSISCAPAPQKSEGESRRGPHG